MVKKVFVGLNVVNGKTTAGFQQKKVKKQIFQPGNGKRKTVVFHCQHKGRRKVTIKKVEKPKNLTVRKKHYTKVKTACLKFLKNQSELDKGDVLMIR